MHDDAPSDAARTDGADRRTEIENLFRLVLGRRPEPGADLSGFMDGALTDLTARFFDAAEFRNRVAEVFARGGVPTEAEFDFPPGADLIDWIGQAFALDPATQEALAGVRTWPQLYRALFARDETAAALGLVGCPFDAPAWAGVVEEAAIDDRGRVIGAADTVDTGTVGGWAVNPVDPARSLTLELWINGVFAGTGTTNRFRRDIEERFPGATGAGFSIPVPVSFAGRPDLPAAEVREAATGRTIGVARIGGGGSAQAGAYEAVRRELVEIRQTLNRLERVLPAIEHGLSYRIEDWGDYFDAWYRPAHQAIRAAGFPSGTGRVRVRIDASDARRGWVEAAVLSALEQSRPAAVIAVAGLDAQGAMLLEDFKVRRAGRGLAGPEVVAGAVPDGEGPVLTFSASGVLAPDAIEAVEGLFARDPSIMAAYVDEDGLAAEADHIGDWRTRPHRAPVLKPDFDPDLMLQTPFTGDCLALAARAWGAVSDEGFIATEALLDLSGRHPIGHLARVLFSRRAEAEADDPAWGERAARSLARTGGDAQVAPWSDILGAEVPGAVRIVAVPPPAVATVIVPTRDRMDLLRPCVDSVLASKAANRTRIELVIVDHRSQEAETRDYLAALQASGEATVEPFDGAFNWALINNRAAARAKGDVLIFLNNDTVVISPDWVDALTAQALRPDVGAVGARLVYQDSSIQHAGMVARDRDTTFLIHEGVGRPGSDAGYLGRHALRHASLTVTGACMAMSAAVFRRLGGFDAAHLPIEGNDVDLCLRARAEGLKVIYEPAATLYHLESRSRGLSQDGERLRQSMEATRRVWSRWGERFRDDPGFNPHFARDGRPFDRLRPPPPIG